MKKLLILSTLLLAMTSSMFTKSKKITIHSIDPKLTISFYHVKDGKKFVDNQGGTAIFDLKMDKTPNAVSIKLNGKEYFINNLASYLESCGFNRNQPGEHSWKLWINYIDLKKNYVEYKIYKDSHDMGDKLNTEGYQYDRMLTIITTSPSNILINVKMELQNDYRIKIMPLRIDNHPSGIIKSTLTDKSTATKTYNNTIKWIADTIAENIKKFQKFCENNILLQECMQSPYIVKKTSLVTPATDDSSVAQKDNSTSTSQDHATSDSAENSSTSPNTDSEISSV